MLVDEYQLLLNPPFSIYIELLFIFQVQNKLCHPIDDLLYFSEGSEGLKINNNSNSDRKLDKF